MGAQRLDFCLSADLRNEKNAASVIVPPALVFATRGALGFFGPAFLGFLGFLAFIRLRNVEGLCGTSAEVVLVEHCLHCVVRRTDHR
jgi:hypothetical protein